MAELSLSYGLIKKNKLTTAESKIRPTRFDIEISVGTLY